MARPLGAAAALVAPLRAQQVGVRCVPLAQQTVHLLANALSHHVNHAPRFEKMGLGMPAFLIWAHAIHFKRYTDDINKPQAQAFTDQMFTCDHM